VRKSKEKTFASTQTASEAYWEQHSFKLTSIKMNSASTLQYPCLARRYLSAPTTTATYTNGTHTETNMLTTTTTAIRTVGNNSTTNQQEEQTRLPPLSSLMACEVAPPTAPTTIPTNNPTEAWKVLYNNPTLKGRVDLQWKTRLDPYATVLDSSLYSPIIYQFEHELTVEGQVPNVIIVKPVVVYDDDNSTHLRALNKDNEMILKGDLEIAMTRHKQTNTFRGHSKIQFTDSSYHHDRKSFRLIWNYSINTTTTNVVNADNSAEQLLHSVISTPFKVFARKPSKKEAATTAATTTTGGKKGSKRKNLEEDDHSGHSTSSDSNSTNSLNVDRVTPTAETDNNQNNNSPVKKVKREVIEVVDEEQQQPTKLPSTNLLTYDLHRTVPSLVNSVTTAVLTHLCKENTQQDLVIELLKQLTDINSRLERLEKMSTTTHLDENPTPNNVNSHHHHGHHHHHHNLQHA